MDERKGLKMAEEKKWINTADASQLLGKTDRQVRRYCQDGQLICKREGKQLLVDADSVETFLQQDLEECPEEKQGVRNSQSDVREMSDTPVDTDMDELNAIEMSDEEDADFQKSLKEMQRSLDNVKHTLGILGGRYGAERVRNRRVQDTLKTLLAELGVPVKDIEKRSLWRRLLG